MRLLKTLLFISAAIAGVIVLVRMSAGPFSFGLAVRSPLNAESLFGVSLTLLFLARPESKAIANQRLHSGIAVIVVAAVTIVCFARALSLSFLSDDFAMVRQASELSLKHFTPLFSTAGLDGFFRPVSHLGFAREYAWAGLNPVLWHAASVAMHVCNSILVIFVSGRLGASSTTSVFAALLFAMHGTRPEAAVWIASRADLQSTLFAQIAFLLFTRAIELVGRNRVMFLSGSVAAFVLAALTKESAYALPLILAVYVISKRNAWIALLPFFGTAAALLLWRVALFGGLGGYRVAGTGESQVFSLRLLTTVKALLWRIWAVLYFPINWNTKPGVLISIAAMAYIAALLWLAARSSPPAGVRTSILFLLVAVLPPLPLLLIGTDLWNSRVLYLPLIGFAAMLAIVLDGVSYRTRYLAGGAILLFHAIVLQHNLSSWMHTSERVRAACRVAADAAQGSDSISIGPMPGHIRGVPAFVNGLDDCVGFFASGRPIAITKESPTLMWDAAEERLIPVR